MRYVNVGPHVVISLVSPSNQPIAEPVIGCKINTDAERKQGNIISAPYELSHSLGFDLLQLAC